MRRLSLAFKRTPVVLLVLAVGVAFGTGGALLAQQIFATDASSARNGSQAEKRKGEGNPPKLESDKHQHKEGEKERPGEAGHGVIKMSAEKIAAAKIGVTKIGAGMLQQHLTVPGTVTTDPDRVARVAAKVVGTVAEMRKRLGDSVTRDEVVAILESREVAEARSEYIAASVGLKLQETLYDRARTLFQKQIMAEQAYLREQNAVEQARLRLQLARQKLVALHSDEDFAALDEQKVTNLRSYELHSPIAGRVVERTASLGAPVGGEGQLKELYTIADLSTVWIELAVPTAELARLKPSLPVVLVQGDSRRNGKIIFVSPMLDRDTRSARVVAEMDNKDDAWRPGTFVSAEIVVQEDQVSFLVPRSALQMIAGEQVIFVRTADGFEKREVAIGRTSKDAVEIVFGLEDGDAIATTNSFVLKAELGKAEAEHSHP